MGDGREEWRAVLPWAAGSAEEALAVVIVACLCLPVGTLCNVATATAAAWDYRRMGRLKPTVLFLLSLVILNQLLLIHFAFQVQRLYGDGAWRLGAEFCAINYGSFPLHQSAAFMLATFLVVSLSEAACHGLKHASNNAVLIAISLLAGLLNSLHSFADYSFRSEPGGSVWGRGGPEERVCQPLLSREAPFWQVFATGLEFLLFYLPSLAVSLVFLCADIRGNPRLPLGAWAAGALVALQWGLWLPKYVLVLAAFGTAALGSEAMEGSVESLRLYSFLAYLILGAAVYPVLCLLIYIVLGHIVLHASQIQTNAKYYDYRPPRIYNVHDFSGY